MKEAEMVKIVEWIDSCIMHHQDKKALAKIKSEVNALCERFPIPGIK
jgi:glycine/serine hydroxymethyltransferase